MTVANRSMGNAQVRISTQSQRGVIWACVLVLAVFAGACVLSPCAMAQVSAEEQAEIDKFCEDYGTGVKITDGNGDTLLHIATRQAKVAVIRFLIDKGADVNAKDKGGDMPIHIAARGKENPEVIKVLVEKGADVNAKDKGGDMPIHIAAYSNENPEVIKVLVEKGADVNAKDKDGDTPLHSAAYSSKNPEVIKVLVENGADVNAKDKDGDTALYNAIILNKNPEVIKMLVENGADVNAKDKDGNTPLHSAAYSSKNPEVIKALIEKGADINAKNNNGETPLHSAASHNKNPEFIKVLVEKGADINAKDKDGNTPLYYAAMCNENPKVIKALLENGADVNAENNNVSTLLINAKYNKNPAEVVELFTPISARQSRAQEGSRIATLTSAIDWMKNINTVKNLAEEPDKSGHYSVAKYVRCGSDEIARTEFVDIYPYAISNVIEEKDGEVSATITVDTEFSATKIGEFASPFPDIRCPVRDLQTSEDRTVEYAFLTKDDTLKTFPRSDSHKMIAAVSKAGGFLYARFQKHNYVTFTIRGGKKSMEELLQNTFYNRVVVLLSGLTYSRKTTPISYHLISDNGTTSTSGDSVPNPFITDESEEVEEVSTGVIKIAIVKYYNPNGRLYEP
ncbi:MAG: ankyrin repeat domain-containing protein [Thermoguttaceae bacterium]